MKRRYWLSALVMSCLFIMALLLGGHTPGRAASQDPVPFQLYHPTFNKNISGFSSTLQLNNFGSQTANVAITLYGSGSTYTDTRIIGAGSVSVIPDSSLSGVPDGVYAVVVGSDQPIESLIHAQRSTGADPLFVYRGSADLATAHFFGPYLKGSIATSVVMFNSADVTANVTATFRSTDGSIAHTQNYIVAAHGTLSLFASTITPLPSGFAGALQITSDQPIAGIMSQVRSTPSYDIEAYPDPGAAAGPGVLRAALPRAFKSVDEGSGSRMTVVFIGNPSSNPANVFLSFYDASGAPIYSQLYSLTGYHSALLDLGTVNALPNGRYSVSLAADQPVVLGSYTYHPAAALYPIGDYEITLPDTALRLPYVSRTNTGHTIVSLQNIGVTTATATISYFTNSGIFVYSHTLNDVKPGQTQPIDQGQLTALPPGYVGYAIVTADQVMQATVDEYLVPPCAAPTGVQISQSPPGPIYTYTPITFTATASGTLPFSYTWTVDSTPLTVTTSTLEGVFAVTGHFTIGVTVTNACGADHADRPVDVQPLPPDLSLSYKSVNLTHVADGDLITYTLVLRNLSPIMATAILTDPIPAHALYVADSASASSGVISFTANEARWQGAIISGTPIILQYAAIVTATSLVPGDRITNTAQLNDGLGNVMPLSTYSIFDPGYRLSINGGALYTNIPTVTLSLSWKNETPPITQMQISNDGGFASGTGWIAVNSTYAPWELTTYSTLPLPRMVYARFRDGNGLQYGPVQDDIIYDPIAPLITQIDIVSPTLRLTPMNRNVIVRVTSSDDNSGTASIQVSDRSDFATHQSFPTTGATTDVPWSLQPTGMVYVRVTDRAGNLSAVRTAHGPGDHNVFLPIVGR